MHELGHTDVVLGTSVGDEFAVPAVGFQYEQKTILLFRYITSLEQIQGSVRQRPAPYTRKLSTDHGTGFSGLSVCVTRMNLARTGLNVATVVAGEPLPSATGVPQVVPSIET